MQGCLFANQNIGRIEPDADLRPLRKSNFAP
jgi:hypothetical protein